jgi:hypothetical protein
MEGIKVRGFAELRIVILGVAKNILAGRRIHACAGMTVM